MKAVTVLFSPRPDNTFVHHLCAATAFAVAMFATLLLGSCGNASSASPPPSPPAAPTGLTATATSSSQINLSWTASAGATAYNVLSSTTSGSGYASVATGVTATSYSNTGLTASTTYYYVVQAVSSAGTSGNSAQASATTQTAPSVPAAPTGLTAAAASSSQINLNWTASSGATSYNVLDSTTSGGPYSEVATGVTTTSYSSTGLMAGSTYYYVVQAVNSAGTSGNSAQASATTLTSSGPTFYVSKSGSDSNPGTSSAPWLTIQHAANSVTAGDTVYVEAGTYNESVTINVSGNSSAGPITFQGASGAIVDGTGVSCCGSTLNGLFNITNQSYIVINGFKIQNYTSSSAADEPAGILIQGSGSNIQLLNNIVTNIATSVEATGNAHGIGIYGQATTPISYVTISGNQVYNLKTGHSETVTLDGNVTNFTVTNNTIHDNDNIGIDAAGFWGVGPSGHDQATAGEISGNTVYNISSINNPAYGGSYGADGIYCDGCTEVIIERNQVYSCDLDIEAASENTGKTSSYVTIRNNLTYNPSLVDISIGGYSSSVGGSDHIVIVNNTLYNNASNQGNDFQVQYYATNNIFENNILYGNPNGGMLLYNFTTSESDPVTMDYNDYYNTTGPSSWAWEWNGTAYGTFSSYQSETAQDAHSQFADPLFDSLTSTPPNLDVQSGSPVINAGSTSLTCSVGYCGSGTSIYGSTDYAGNARINGSGQINIGAYEQ